MANPAKLTVTPLVPGTPPDRPAGSTIDTNGTVPIEVADFGGYGGWLVIEVIESNTRALTVKVLAGDNPPAVRSGLGDLTVAITQNTGKVIGPIETARFAQNDGDIHVSFTGTGGAAAATVRTYLLPKAV
jgi:hypothetical protein